MPRRQPERLHVRITPADDVDHFLAHRLDPRIRGVEVRQLIRQNSDEKHAARLENTPNLPQAFGAIFAGTNVVDAVSREHNGVEQS
jgi:hypothetical protein